MRLCARCGIAWVIGPWQRSLCDSCRGAGDRESKHRYDVSERGRAKNREWANSPRGKLARGRYAERHREQIQASRRRWRARHPRPPRIVACAAQPCPSAFVRGRRQGAKRLCDECAAAVYGNAYVRARKVA